MSARFPSRKMGCVIQAESHRVELAAIHVMEYDPAILEYYDQPPRIPLHYRSPNGRAVAVQHTPDFFVIGRTWVGWEEWKTAARLVELTHQMPGRYVQEDQAGRTAWRCPPGEAHARQVGLAYRVRCDEEINWSLQRNIQFLMDYWGDDVDPVDARTVKRVNGWVDASDGTRLVDVLRLAREHDLNPDVIYTLIAQDYWYVDLQAAPLAQPDRVLVRRERPAEHPASDPQIPDGILGTAEATSAAAKMSLLTPRARQILESASPRDLAIANGRWRILEPVLRGEAHPAASQEVPERTLYRWRQDYYDAERQYGVGYVGLIPHVGQQGNHQRKLPLEVVDLMEKVIREHYETAKRRSAQSVYGALVQQCDQRGWTAPSYKTFLEAVHRRPADQQIRQREGKRAAYATTPFYWELSLTTPRHGDRIFEVGHVDHTQLDIELVSSATGWASAEKTALPRI